MKNLFISYAYENENYTTSSVPFASHAASEVITMKNTGYGNTVISGDDKKLETHGEIVALERHIELVNNYKKVTIINFRRVE